MSFLDAFKNSLDLKNNSSPFGEAGLLGDPLHYALGDKYDNFMRKTWEYPNQYVGQAITKFDTYDRKVNPLHKAIDNTAIGGKIADAVHNKPGDSALAVLGAIYGGGSLLGSLGSGSGGVLGGGGAGAGGSGGGGALSGWAPSSNLGVFANGGTGGLSGVGGGNAGALAASHGISGGAGIGSAQSGGMLGSLTTQDYLKLAQQMPQQQQQPQQQRPLQPVVIRGRVFWL